jgi:hypothetical protein
VKTVGVARAHRRRGLMDALIVSTIEHGSAHYDNWLGAMMREDNPSTRLSSPHARHERRYALYGKVLDDLAA